jgi:hypothetical protein
MKQIRIVLLVLLVVALATLACSLSKVAPGGQGEEAAQPEATQTSTTEASQPTAVETGEEAPAPGPEPTESPSEEAQPPATEPAEAPAEGTEGDTEEADLDLQTSLSGLEDLNSYRAAFRFDWNGTQGGEPVTGYMEMQSAFVREPPAQELFFEGQGFAGEEDQGLGKISFVQVDDTAWFYEGESDAWMQVPAGSLDFSEGLFFRPEDLLQDFDVGKARRSLLPTQRNGVECHVYKFNEKDFDLTEMPEGSEVQRAEGEVCVAVDGNYVVQLILDADFRYTDPDEIFEEGNVKMTFDISDVNQPFTIEPPAEAEAQTGGRDDIPMLSDAQVEFSTAEFITYRTTSSPADAAEFYENEMPNQGWTAGGDNMVSEDSAFLDFQKDSTTANVIIGTDENGTNVVITITQE